MDEGLPKLWLIHRALTLRRERPEWFGPEAGYAPLEASGRHREHVIAALRGDSVAAIAPRLTLRLEDWADTAVELPRGRWRNQLTQSVLSGGRVKMSELLREFPVALLTKEEERDA